MLEKDMAFQLSRELRIDLFTIYREYLQILFLKYFYRQKESQKIYFKGGTAIRLLYGSFRFSEDLDFTSLVKAEGLKDLIAKSIRELSAEVTSVYFKKTKSMAESFSGRIFQELPEFKIPISIRLDFSLREKPVLSVDSSYLETIFPVSPYPLISHLKAEEMLAEKIRAILTRCRGRDVFDIWFLLSKKVAVDWKLVNKKMAIYKKKANKEDLLRALEEFPQEEIKSDLARFLPTSHRGLIKEIKKLAVDKIKNL
jgi:predicted nucleotidyltransferase component of viral defense system